MPLLMQIKDDIVQNKIALNEKTLSIGRAIDNDVQLEDATVSANHAWIEYIPNNNSNASEQRYRLVDLDSTNGCFINEKKVSEQIINHNDILRIGFVSFKFIDENEHRFEETAKVHKSWIPGVYYTKS